MYEQKEKELNDSHAIVQTLKADLEQVQSCAAENERQLRTEIDGLNDKITEMQATSNGLYDQLQKVRFSGNQAFPHSCTNNKQALFHLFGIWGWEAHLFFISLNWPIFHKICNFQLGNDVAVLEKMATESAGAGENSGAIAGDNSSGVDTTQSVEALNQVGCFLRFDLIAW